MSDSLKAFHADLGALIAKLGELEAVASVPAEEQASLVRLEHENDQLRSVIKIIRVKAQALADAVAPGKAPKEVAKWESERKALMDAIKISREAVP